MPHACWTYTLENHKQKMFFCRTDHAAVSTLAPRATSCRIISTTAVVLPVPASRHPRHHEKQQRLISLRASSSSQSSLYLQEKHDSQPSLMPDYAWSDMQLHFPHMLTAGTMTQKCSSWHQRSSSGRVEGGGEPGGPCTSATSFAARARATARR